LRDAMVSAWFLLHASLVYGPNVNWGELTQHRMQDADCRPAWGRLG